MTIARRLVAFLSVLSLVPLFVLAAVSSPAAAAPAAPSGSLFTPIPGAGLGGNDLQVRPSESRAYRVDLAGMRQRLGGEGTVAVTIPDPAGTPTTFHVVEHSIMEPELQAAHPDIRTYRGADDQGSTISLDVTPFGFHALVRRPDGVTWLVDPAFNEVGENRVLSYAGGSTEAPSFVERELDLAIESAAPAAADRESFSTPGGIVSKRTYRIAFLTDNTYAAYHGTTDALVFAAKTSMMNRVNQVYNDDLAMEFLLIAGTDTRLNFNTVAKMTGTNGPCGASACFTTADVAECTGGLLNRLPFAIGQVMGAENFDIGHIGLGNTGGGVAGLGVVGGPNKAVGCTGLTTPTGDLYAIDYVAHEVGHQMGGNHTFDSATCNANRNAGTSVEPGSGSSIMAYAGICGADNLQAHSDPYFSQRSVDEIEATAAAAPSTVAETQSVAMTGLAAGEQISITCAGCSTQTVTFTGNGATDNAALVTAVSNATGSVATVRRYDSGAGGGLLANANGFAATWVSGADIPTLVVTPVVAGQFTALVGTIFNGGPTTNGGTVTASTNSSPTITAGPADKSIPARTPFELTATAADANGDQLTYMWEQNNIGGASGTALQADGKTVGPLFRQFGTAAPVTSTGTLQYNSPGENLAGTSPTRTFPDIAQIVAGNTNAASGTCPTTPPAGQTVVDCFSEYLPANARTLNFRLSVRDEFTPDAPADHVGGLTRDDVALTVVPTAGPFLVSSPNTAVTLSGAQTVTWAVAGTNTAALATNVRISLSTDGGLTYPTELVATTANDGSESVTLPNINTTTARIKVQAVGNYFFDISNANFTITPAAGNVAPTVNAGLDASVTVNTPFTQAGSFTDETPATATATVDYGDGAGQVPLTLTGSTFSLNHTYTTTGAKTVTVRVTDSAGLVGTDTVTVTVNAANVAPTVNAGPDTSVTVNTLFTQNGSFTDESPGTATATVDYGDGAGQQALPLTGSTFNLSRTYTTTGVKTVTVRVTDAAGQVGTDTVQVTVNAAANVAPTVNAGLDGSVTVNTPFTQAGSFTDETPATATATVNYGDGGGAVPLTLTGSTFTLSHTYTTTGPKTITVVVTDSAGLTGTDTVMVNVTAAADVAPTVNAGADTSVTVNTVFTRSGSFTDEAPATATATVNYGDGGGAVPLTLTGSSFTLSHTYTTTGPKTITVVVTDAGGQSGTDTVTVTVNPTGGGGGGGPVNTPPVVNAGPDATATVGTAFSGSGSFTDDSSGPFTATVDYGDGGGAQPLTLTGTTFALSHTYTTSGPKTITVTVTDPGALSGTDTVTVTVNPAPGNATPVVNAGPDATVTAGSAFTAAGSFADDSTGPFSATVDYGDGAGPQALVVSGKNFTLSHVYTVVGAKTVTVRVTDNNGATGTDTVTVTVVAGPPSPSQHVGDGQGKFRSKPGSSSADPDAEGNAKFTFTVDRTGTTPSGSASFRFAKGGVEFAGVAVTSASVSGKTLTLVVQGTDNGKSGFTLVVVAKDGAKDKIRVRLLKGSKVKYDSMPGKPASKGPKTKLISGGITVV